MKRQPKRTCATCGKANGTLFSVCNPCRQQACDHATDHHYDSTHALICQCGLILVERKKIIGHSNGAGVFPGAMMSHYRAEDLS